MRQARHGERSAGRGWRYGDGHGRVAVAEPFALDQDLGAGDQHDAKLPSFGIEVGGASDGPLLPAAVAQAIAAPELAEPPG
jgi:hypothetical protein